MAAELMLEVIRGNDPAAARSAAPGSAAVTFAAIAARYVTEHAQKRNKSWRQADALIRRHVLPAWASLPATAITRANVRELIGAIAAPIAANQVLAAFTWAIKQELLTINPARGVERNTTTSRGRVLSDAEVPLFWNAFSTTGIPGTALKVLPLTGQRPGEITHMRHEHITDGWWTMPGAPDAALKWPGTKNAATHRVYLPAKVRDILGPAAHGFVFGSPQPLAETMRDICKALNVPRCAPHDLRRSHGTMITSLGFGREAMNRVQNHREGGIADVYDRHEYAEENKRIMETVAQRIIACSMSDQYINSDPDDDDYGDCFLPRHQICSLTRLSYPTVWQQICDGDFPPARRISKTALAGSDPRSSAGCAAALFKFTKQTMLRRKAMANKQNKVTPATDAEAVYREAVEEGKAATAQQSGSQWVLGDLALKVEKSYGENRLKRFAKEINFAGAVCTLARYRPVCRAYPKTGVRARFFASAHILQAHPDRIKIVETNSDISKAEARAIMSEWRAAHPEAEAEDQLEEDDEELDEPGPTPTVSTPARKTNGRKKMNPEPVTEWSAHGKRWQSDVVVAANKAVELAEVRKSCTPEQRRDLLVVLEAPLIETVRKAGEALSPSYSANIA
ncbi:MAG TPA: hypothetical protein VGI22_15820 [Xanthobacteraceae bacterium]